MIRLENIIFNRNGDFTLDIDKLAISKGEIIGIIGPNGSGKTTLLEIIALLLKPLSGNIFINNSPVNKSNRKNYLDLFSMVLQDPYLFNMSVEKNIELGLKFRKIDTKIRKRKIKEILSAYNLEGLSKRYSANLSGGEKQQVAVLRSLIINPDVLLLDEPFSGVDITQKEKLQNLLLEVNKSKKTTIIFTTHILEEAFKIANRLILLKDGKIDSLKNI